MAVLRDTIGFPPVASLMSLISWLRSSIWKAVISLVTVNVSNACANSGYMILQKARTTLTSLSKNSSQSPLSSVTFIWQSMKSILRASPLIGVAFICSMLMSGSWRLVWMLRLSSSVNSFCASVAWLQVAYPALSPFPYRRTFRPALSSVGSCFLFFGAVTLWLSE